MLNVESSVKHYVANTIYRRGGGGMKYGPITCMRKTEVETNNMHEGKIGASNNLNDCSLLTL